MALKYEQTVSLKDLFFNTTTVTNLAISLKKADTYFEVERFVEDCVDSFPALKLKERITHIANVLYNYLPQSYPDALSIILNALPAPLDPSKTDDDFGEFILAPFAEYVMIYGCSKTYFDLSRNALKEITKRFSVEFAVRKFINTDPDRMYQYFLELSGSDNYHQRRLVSEGSREQLPWAEKIVWTEQQIIHLLDRLFADKTRYVTRSVANNLNGISKKNPTKVLQTLDRREKTGKQTPGEMGFIIRHSLRTLLKQGYRPALQKIGYTLPTHISLSSFETDSSVTIGEYFHYSFTLSTDSDMIGLCRIEYQIGYVKSRGQFSYKRFKCFEGSINTKTITIKKKHSFKPMSTRVHYSGTHTCALVINGSIIAESSFEVVE